MCMSAPELPSGDGAFTLTCRSSIAIRGRAGWRIFNFVTGCAEPAEPGADGGFAVVAARASTIISIRKSLTPKPVARPASG